MAVQRNQIKLGNNALAAPLDGSLPREGLHLMTDWAVHEVTVIIWEYLVPVAI